MHELVSLQHGNSLLTDLDQDISTQCTVMDKSCFTSLLVILLTNL